MQSETILVYHELANQTITPLVSEEINLKSPNLERLEISDSPQLDIEFEQKQDEERIF